MATNTPQPDSSRHDRQLDNRSTRTQPNKLLLFGAGAALLVAIGLYWGGLSRGRSQVAAQKTEYEQRIHVLRNDLHKTQEQLLAARNLSLLMQARAAFYRTAVDLDHRNFGTANKHLQEAATVLSKIDNSDGKLDRRRISQLHSSAAEMNINVATDLEEQRGRVLEFAAQLNALLPQTP